MSTEAGLDLVRALVAAVARPTARDDEVTRVLAAAGYPSPVRLITRLPASRLGADLRLRPGDEIRLDHLEAAFGPSRMTSSLDEEGPEERYWDIAVADTEHVILVAELDGTATTALGVRLTPYSFAPTEEE